MKCYGTYRYVHILVKTHFFYRYTFGRIFFIVIKSNYFDLSQSKYLITKSLQYIISIKKLLSLYILKNLRWLLNRNIFITWSNQFWIWIPVIESDQAYGGKDTSYKLIKIIVYLLMGQYAYRSILRLCLHIHKSNFKLNMDKMSFKKIESPFMFWYNSIFLYFSTYFFK